jgi:hypothetical protein
MRVWLVVALALALVVGASSINMVSAKADDDEEEIWEYGYFSDDSVYIKGYNGCDTNVVIPEEIDGHKVTSIENEAFEYNKYIVSVSIPSGVTDIGEYAFDGCFNLETVTFPSGLQGIGSHAFWNCYNLKNITLPSGLKAIGTYAFQGCNSITSIVIPAGVEGIASYAFNGCYYLDNVTITSSLTSIGRNAFMTVGDNFLMICHENSEAQEYAEDENCNYVTFEAIKAIEGTKVGNVKTSIKKSGTKGYVQVTWSSISKASYYRVYRKENGGARKLVSGSLYATSYTDYSVKSGNKYTYDVVACVTGSTGEGKEYVSQQGAGTTINFKLANSISASNKNLTIGGKSVKIGARLTVGNGKLTYKSSNTKVVTVSSTGVLKPKSIGTATIQIKAAGTANYKAATKKIKVSVNPKGTKLVSLSNAKTSTVWVKWKKIKGVAGYQIRYATNSSFSGARIRTYSKKTSKAKLTGLYSGTKYYVQVRIIKKIGSKKYYSDWSGRKTANTLNTRLSTTSTTLYNGLTKTLYLNNAPGTVKWSSGNTYIATVDKYGVVTAKHSGSVTITAKSGGETYNCYVTVKDCIKATPSYLRVVNGSTLMAVKFTNKSGKNITYVTFKIYQYDNRGYSVTSPYSSYCLNDTVYANKSGTWFFTVNSFTKKARIEITKVWYKDGTTWTP